MFDRLPPMKRKCRNFWEMQPRTVRGLFLSYDGSSPGVEAAARVVEMEKRRARGRASMQTFKENLEGAILMHILGIMVAAPPGVQRELAAWDAPREAGYL